MKKNLLMALVALMAFALSGNAQNNTYNMVIEMANGTKITIGPNDVKNISFNDGELVMTGEDINTLVERQNEADARIKMIEAQGQNITMQVTEYIADLKAEIARLQAELNAISAGGSAAVPTIGEDGYWYINGEKTAYRAIGRDGVAGENGMDADMWTIGDDGYWYQNGMKTTYRAVAQDGVSVELLSEYMTKAEALDREAELQQKITSVENFLNILEEFRTIHEKRITDLEQRIANVEVTIDNLRNQ